MSAVRDFPRPRDGVEVKRFVHLAGYYRRFVGGFGSTMAPLTKLLRKGMEWEWTTAQEFAFEHVKLVLTNKLLLLYPDFRLPFQLVTDASKVGLGACLMQDHGNGWQPIGYASKVNSKTEENYGITELKCLAVVWAIKLFRPYLYGRKFTIVTDHAALKWLMTSPNLTGKLHRWARVLQEFEFDVEYRPGNTNVVADALSRAPIKVLAAVGRRRRARNRRAQEGTDGITEGQPATTSAALPVVETTSGAKTRSSGKVVGGNYDEELARATDSSGEASGYTASGDTAGASVATAGDITNSTSVAAAGGGTGSTVATTVKKANTAAEDEELDKLVKEPTGLDKETGSPDQTPRHWTRAAKRKASETVRRAGAAGTEMVATETNEVTKETKKHKHCSLRATRTQGPRGKTVTWAPSVEEREAKPSVTSRSSNSNVRNSPKESRETSRPKPVPEVRERARIATGPTLQLTDEDIAVAQGRSRLVRKLVDAEQYKGMSVVTEYGLVLITTPAGKRVVLPPELWSAVFKEAHDSVWAGHLRAPHTSARITQVYWWPNIQREVKRWVLGCQECGSRKARPREVVPPLRSLSGGDVGDRWVLDVAGPLPVTAGGQRYVIAAIEYVTRYAVAVAVERHTAENVAAFIMKEVVLRFGPFRELLTDGAPELTGKTIEQLVVLLQAEQINPVPYRPQMIGLVERFHRTWKACVSTYMHLDEQCDWDKWVSFAVYAYNSGRHTTVALSPNELMMGRRLRAPNELLRRTNVSEAGELTSYHGQLVAAMQDAHRCAEVARVREQDRQARYYNQRTRTKRTFEAGDRVWLYRPPRGAKASKFVHNWMGPMKIIEPAGYENFLIRREDTDGDVEDFLAHVSFLVSYREPVSYLRKAAADINEQLEYEEQFEPQDDATLSSKAARPATALIHTAAPAGSSTKRARTVDGEDDQGESSSQLVELRRRRRRNRAGQVVLEYELRPARIGHNGDTSYDGAGRWVSVTEYDALFQNARVVEDSGCGEGV